MSDADSTSARPPVDATEVDALRAQIAELVRDNQRLQEGRLDLVREMNRVIALGDFSVRCATAEHPSEVLEHALGLLGDILAVDLRTAFGFTEEGAIDSYAFARAPTSAQRRQSSLTIDADLLTYLQVLSVATIQHVEDGVDPDFTSLLEALFPLGGPWKGATVLVLPLRPSHSKPMGCIVACKRPDDASPRSGPQEDDATFLVLLSNHLDRALQAAILVSDLRSRSEELAESTRRFRDSLEHLERTQKQLLQARKLEAIGRLAGGVAHDFNNLLTVIRNHVEFLHETLAAGSSELEDVTAIGEATDRATRITRQLLAFGRRNEGRPEVLDVNKVTSELTRGIGRLVGEHVRIDLRLDPTISVVRADRAQLEQVLLNLLVNARDAMPEGGTISLRTSHPGLDDLAEAGITPGQNQYIMLSVTDTGHGMDEATRTRLFEPFFTTKGHGHGTGLGLATVYGIVEKHGGQINVNSVVGRGTTFSILLPVARKSSTTMEAVKGPSGAPSAKKKETGTILLVEDDTGLRRVALRTLRSKGYSVFEAADGIDALAIANVHLDDIDLVITDVVMPRMAGPKLVAELRLRRPDIRVMYVSGYTFDMLDPKTLEDGAFLAKPFSPDDLLGAVKASMGIGD